MVQAEAAFADEGDLPRVFGDYVLLRHLAQGGMGDVFLAKSRGGGLGVERPCVVKALRPDLATDRHYVARFVDEARLVVQLQHPNICHVFDVGRVGDQLYVAMEHVSGWNVGPLLARSIEKQTPVPMEAFIYVAAEALSALDYAHKLADAGGRHLELVHRDVSPHNVMITDDGQVKLLDFGIASSRLKMERTAPQVVIGKLAYMSPEQARGERISGSVDQFAAGVMLYEMVVRERFYQGLSTDEIWQRVGRGGYRPRLFSALPADLRPILDRALAAKPEERFPSCGDFEDALRTVLGVRRAPIGPGHLRDVLRKLFLEEKDDDKTELFEEAPEATSSGVFFDAALETVHFATAQFVRPAGPDEPTESHKRAVAAPSSPPRPSPPAPARRAEPLPPEQASAAPRASGAASALPPSTPVMQKPPSSSGLQKPPSSSELQKPPSTPGIPRPPSTPSMGRPPSIPGMPRAPERAAPPSAALPRTPSSAGMPRPPGLAAPPVAEAAAQPTEVFDARGVRTDTKVRVKDQDRRPLVLFGVLGTLILLLVIFAAALLLRSDDGPTPRVPKATEDDVSP